MKIPKIAVIRLSEAIRNCVRDSSRAIKLSLFNDFSNSMFIFIVCIILFYFTFFAFLSYIILNQNLYHILWKIFWIFLNAKCFCLCNERYVMHNYRFLFRPFKAMVFFFKSLFWLCLFKFVIENAYKNSSPK